MYNLANFNTFSRPWKPISQINTFSTARGNPVRVLTWKAEMLWKNGLKYSWNSRLELKKFESIALNTNSPDLLRLTINELFLFQPQLSPLTFLVFDVVQVVTARVGLAVTMGVVVIIRIEHFLRQRAVCWRQKMRSAWKSGFPQQFHN